jgi:predicted transcriptional regulator
VQTENLDVLFNELASETRIAILQELSIMNLKMHDLSRKLDITPTEASRQLQRMSKAKLIERISDGSYTISPYGKLVMHLTSAFNFIFKNKDYFAEHDIWQIPDCFINRLGEISESTLVLELPEAMLRWESMFRNAAEYVWVMTPQVMPNLSQIMKERLLQGVKLKSLLSDNPNPSLKPYILRGINVEKRSLPEIMIGIVLTETESSFCLPQLDGEMVIHVFFGNDSSFMKWTRELYLHFWDQGIVSLQ